MSNSQRYNLRSSAQQGMATSLQVQPPSTNSSVARSNAFTTSNPNTSSLPTMTNIPQSQYAQGGVAHLQQPAGFGSNNPAHQQPGLLQQQQYGQTQPSADVIPAQGSQAMGEGGAAATAPFLRDFTLVAEAVKRVQMDAMMTEMESISL